MQERNMIENMLSTHNAQSIRKDITIIQRHYAIKMLMRCNKALEFMDNGGDSYVAYMFAIGNIKCLPEIERIDAHFTDHGDAWRQIKRFAELESNIQLDDFKVGNVSGTFHSIRVPDNGLYFEFDCNIDIKTRMRDFGNVNEYMLEIKNEFKNKVIVALYYTLLINKVDNTPTALGHIFPDLSH